MERKELEERLLLMEAQAERQANDPLFNWEPHDKQRAFINSVLGYDFYENWFVAANRSGKSDAGAFAGATLARFGVEPVRSSYALGGRIEIRDRATSGWVVSLDTPSSRDIVQPKYFNNGFVPGGATHLPFIPDREIKDWRAGDQILLLKNGSIVGFKSCESGRPKFQGTEKDWIHFDEEPPKSIYTECTIRIGAGKRLRIFGTCTLLPPEGQVGGVTWVFSEILQPYMRGMQSGIGCFGASMYDNPYLEVEEIKRLEAKYPEGSIERRIRIDGEWLPGLSGARAYQAFNRALHVHTQPAPILRLPLCWAWDFNVEPMVSLVGQRINGVFHIYQEFIMEEGNIPGMVDRFRLTYPTHQAEVWIFGDATGKARTSQTGKSDYQLIANGMRTYPVPYRIRVPESNPHVPDRINAVNVSLRNEVGSIGAEIDPSCEELIADFEQVLRDSRGGLMKTRNRHDPYFRRTHTSDAYGYWVSVEQPVRSNAPAKPKGTGRPSKAASYAWSKR